MKADDATLGTLSSDDARDPAEAVAADAAVLAGRRYQAHEEVARGGAGRIVRARDLALDREVALKLPLEVAGSARLRAEAHVLARLQHPSIVPVYDAGVRPDGLPFFAMKLVDGKSLREVIAATTTLEERLALIPIVVAIAEAIAYAHAQGILHRDLKPGNVLVGSFGETIVIDWGLATPDGNGAPIPDDVPFADTVTGAVLGTPAYMPPEQARGEPVGPTADVYAIGAILHHLLTGDAPYRSGSASSVITQVLAGPPAPVERSQPRVPVDLAAIVAKAMARAPADRYPTAKHLADDLVRFQTGRLVAARRYSIVARTRRWIVRHRAGLAIALVALAGAGTAAGLAMRGAAAPGAACASSGDHVRAVWTPARADAIRAGFAANHLPYAGTAATSAIAALDRQADAIAGARIDACRATYARGEQSNVALDLRMHCLDRRLDQLSALGDALARADADGVDRSGDAVALLDDVGGCADPHGDAALAPADPAYPDLRASLDTAEAGLQVGDDAAGKDAPALLATARRIDDCPTLAEALWVAGLARRAGGDDMTALTEAVSLLRESARVADRCGADVTRAQALVALSDAITMTRAPEEEQAAISDETRSAAHRAGIPRIEIKSEAMQAADLAEEGDLDRAISMGEEALAAAKQLGDLEIQSSAEGLLAGTYLDKDDVERALPLAQAAVDHKRAALGDGHPDLASELTGLAVAQLEHGDDAAAKQSMDEAVAIVRARHGDDHRDTLLIEESHATLLVQIGQLSEARVEYEAMVPRVAKAYGEDDPIYATLLDDLTKTQRDLGDSKAALATARALVEVRKRSRGADAIDTAQALDDLAAAQQAGGDPRAAIASLEAAMAIDDRRLPPNDPAIAELSAALGAAWIAAGQPSHAIQPLENAVAIRRDRGEAPELAAADLDLATAMWAGGERDKAIAAATEARGGDPDAADQWLAAHPKR